MIDSRDTPHPKDALLNFRKTAPREIQEQVALFREMSPEDRLELLFYFCCHISAGLDQLYSDLSDNCQCGECTGDGAEDTMTQ